MPIHISWLNAEKTIIAHTYEEPWTLKDYYELIHQNYNLIDSVGHIVDIINDLRGLRQLPPDIVSAIRHAAVNAHDNEGLNVLVAADTLTRSLVDSVYDSTYQSIYFADTVADALKLIQKEQAKRNQS